jgi:hypothetical protein
MMSGHVAAFLGGRVSRSGSFSEYGESAASLEAARFGAECLQMVNEEPKPGIVGFVESCWRQEGGFAMHTHDPSPSLDATYYGLRVLQITGNLDFCAPDPIICWLLKGIFSEAAGPVSVDVDDLYYALRALTILGARLPANQMQAAVRFLASCMNEGGGFARLPGTCPDIERTYCCINSFSMLGLDTPEVSKHARWVEACVERGRFYSAPHRPDSSLATMYWGSRSAELLRLSIGWDSVEAEIFCYGRSDGGFGGGSWSTLWETYCALGTLRIAQAMLSEEAR